MSSYLYFKNQRKKHTQVWAAAVWVPGLTAISALCCLAMGSVLSRLPLHSGLERQEGCDGRTPQLRLVYITMIQSLTNWKPRPTCVGPSPPLTPTPGRPWKGLAALTGATCTGRRGHLLLWNLLLEKEQTFLPRTTPHPAPSSLVGQIGSCLLPNQCQEGPLDHMSRPD